MKICFFPYKTDSNKYIEILVESLVERDIEVVSFIEMFTDLKTFCSVKLIHLNWYESLYGKSMFVRIILFVLKICILYLLKICNKKIVWTMHNKRPHERRLTSIQNILMQKIITYSSKIIIHSKQSKDYLINNFNIKDVAKIYYVPHPNYIGVYGDPVFPCRQNNKLHLLFLGAVKPYKNIELLIDVVRLFPQTVELTIAGNAKRSKYKEKLEKYVNNDLNIRLNLEFIRDDKIADYIAHCDLTIFPYDISSSLNSGSVFLSFSYGKSVICPMIATISDLPVFDYILAYDYKTREEHFIQLSEKLGEAIELWNTNPAIFEQWGQTMKEYVKTNNSKFLTVDSLLSVYESI